MFRVDSIVSGERGKSHDQDTGGASQGPGIVAMSDELASALEQLRLQGALFFRSELTEPFASRARLPWPTRWSQGPSG